VHCFTIKYIIIEECIWKNVCILRKKEKRNEENKERSKYIGMHSANFVSVYFSILAFKAKLFTRAPD
jgi:D-alanyl-lipoteichoic acid acyltransferase DltB (MBOAT superfamily)